MLGKLSDIYNLGDTIYKWFTGGSHLSQIFGSVKICLAYQYYYTKKRKKNNFGKKIQTKQQSGLTTVQLKWDPPITFSIIHLWVN